MFVIRPRRLLLALLALPLVAAAVVGAFVLPAWGMVDPVEARSGYLYLVLFHGWLELGVLAAWWSGRSAG